MAAILRGGADGDEPISEINVTPFVDVVLVLLVIFMVTAPFIVRPAIPVRLPEAATGERPPESPLTITIAAAGEIRANGVLVRLDELPGLVASAGEPATMPVVVDADRDVPYGEVVRVLDRLRAAGARRFAVSVRPAAGAAEREVAL